MSLVGFEGYRKRAERVKKLEEVADLAKQFLAAMKMTNDGSQLIVLGKLQNAVLELDKLPKTEPA